MYGPIEFSEHIPQIQVAISVYVAGLIWSIRRIIKIEVNCFLNEIMCMGSPFNIIR